MENSRFLECLAADFARLRAVVPGNLAAAVPTCPGWTVTDLARHVGAVYLHKAVAIRKGAKPDPWPPDGLAEEDPLTLLDRAYPELVAELAARDPAAPAWTWYPPDQSVGFWIRRMAQETVIHRIDAEFGAGQPVAPIPADLATDGVDELLKVFLGYGAAESASEFVGVLDNSPGWTFTLRTDAAAWRVRTGPGLVTVEDGLTGATADVTIEGPPAALLRWVWNRESPGEPGGVTITGPQQAVGELQRCLSVATQ